MSSMKASVTLLGIAPEEFRTLLRNHLHAVPTKSVNGIVSWVYPWHDRVPAFFRFILDTSGNLCYGAKTIKVRRKLVGGGFFPLWVRNRTDLPPLGRRKVFLIEDVESRGKEVMPRNKRWEWEGGFIQRWWNKASMEFSIL